MTIQPQPQQPPHWLTPAIDELTAAADDTRYTDPVRADHLDTAAGMLTHIRDSGLEQHIVPIATHVRDAGLTHAEVKTRLAIAPDAPWTIADSAVPPFPMTE